jgi:hypothetical protein
MRSRQLNGRNDGIGKQKLRYAPYQEVGIRADDAVLDIRLNESIVRTEQYVFHAHLNRTLQ